VKDATVGDDGAALRREKDAGSAGKRERRGVFGASSCAEAEVGNAMGVLEVRGMVVDDENRGFGVSE
jgi:hypothetical protein